MRVAVIFPLRTLLLLLPHSRADSMIVAHFVDFAAPAAFFARRLALYVLLALIVYAQAIAASEIRIMNPINEKVRQYYESFDMIYVKKGDYLVRKV